MGERALAACPVAEQRASAVEGPTFDWYAAQWAASQDAIRDVFDQSTEGLSHYDWQYRGRQDWPTMVETLDFLQFEAVYRFSRSGVRVYLPLWLGFGPDDQTAPSTGVLVETHSVTEFRQLRALVQRLKTTLGTALDERTISLEVAQNTLLAVVSSRGWHHPN